MLKVPDPLRPFEQPLWCARCQERHLGKTYHLDLDDQGAVIVSFGVLDRLRPLLASHDLQMSNMVAEPPPMTIGG
jgi:hypothetical protein